MKKIGRLIHVWCMRFEAKHNFFKRSVRSFKNLTKSLVKQRQLAFHYENYSFNRFEFGPVRVKNVCNLEGGEILQQTLELDPSSEVSTTSWVKSYGTEYQMKCVMSSLFLKRSVLLLFTDRVFFVLHVMCVHCTLMNT